MSVVRRFDVLLAVLAGGCAGGAARFAVVRAWPTGSSGFPWSTLAVNLSGAAILGALVVFAAAVWRSRYARPLLGTGFCGAFTTFSTLAFETWVFFEERAWRPFALNLALSLGLGLLAVWAGF